MDKTQSHIALYGNSAILRCFCSKCQQFALVVDGRVQCCGNPMVVNGEISAKRMIESEQKRRRPLSKEKRMILEEQNNRCLYCRRSFGAVVYIPRSTKTSGYDRQEYSNIVLKPCWDHFVPYSYNQDNGPHNFVAACQVCNGIKSDMIFQAVRDARVHIMAIQEVKGISERFQ